MDLLGLKLQLMAIESPQVGPKHHRDRIKDLA